MLLNPGEDKNGSNDNKKEKLLHTDEENSKITNKDPDPSSLFGKSMNIDSNDDGNENVVLTNPTSEDDIVSDSFAISFKANDPINNVSDKLKQEQNSLNERDKSLEDEFEDFDFDNSNFSAFKTVSTPEPITDVPDVPAPVFPPVTPAAAETPKPARDSFDDEFDEFENFEFDSSVSAFKPLNNAGISDDKKESSFMDSLKTPPISEPKKEEESAKPVFKVGAPIDVEKTPEVKETDIDLKAKPFDVDNTDNKKTENVPVFNDEDKDLESFSDIKKDKSKDDLFSKGDDLDFATSDADKKDSPFANAEKPEEIDDSKLQTFGTVSSGVNAFKKQPKEEKAEVKNEDPAPSPFKKAPEAKKESSPFKPAPAPAAKKEEPSPFKQAPAPAAKKEEPSPFKQAPAPAAKKEEPSPFKQAPAPAAKKEEPSPFKQTSAPAAKKEEPSPFKQNAAPAAKKEEPSPFKQNAAPAANKEEATPFNPNKTAAGKKEAAAPFNPNKTAAAKKEDAAPFNPNKTAAAEKKQEAPAEKAPEQPRSEEAPKAEDKPKAKPTPEDGLMKKPFNPSSEKIKAQQSRPGGSSDGVKKMNNHNTSLYPMNSAPKKPPVDAFKAPPRTDAKPQSRPGRATTYVAASQRGNIAPVTTVTQKKHGGKESGKGGLIALIMIIIVFVSVILVLSNLDKIKSSITGNRIVETISTTTGETTAPAESSDTSSEETTTTAEETTTTAEETTTTAEETTTTAEETTTTTTVEETTTTTTAEETTTTTTVEETTTTTTVEETTTTVEETTTTAAPVTSGGEKVTNFNTKIKGFSKTAGGFKFKIIMTNKSNKTASLAKSLNHLRISLNSSAPIKKLTCDGFKFSGSGKTFKGVPADRTIAPGETVTYTVTAKCSSTPAHYGYNNGFFDWK